MKYVFCWITNFKKEAAEKPYGAGCLEGRIVTKEKHQGVSFVQNHLNSLRKSFSIG